MPKIKIDAAGIEAALEKLTEKYPTAECAIWTRIGPDGTHRYVAYVDPPIECGIGTSRHGGTPEAAADKLIAEFEILSPGQIRDKKIASLRAELAKLEGEAAPAQS